MKLEIARGLFLIGSLGIAVAATAAWQEPGPKILTQEDCAEQPCPEVSERASSVNPLEADGDNLLLFMYGLTQALRGEQ